MGFKNTRGTGFHITFDNGITVSVQFGAGTYSDHHDAFIDVSWQEGNKKAKEEGSSRAEVGIFREDNGEWLTTKFKDSGEDVLGYQTPKQVLEALIWAEQYKP